MKQIILILFTTSCAVILFIGNQQWKDKVVVKGSSTETITLVEEEDTSDSHHQEVVSFASNWPEEASANFEAAVKEGRPFKILLAGSPAMGTESEGWAAILKNELEDTFGETMSVSVRTYKMTSKEFIEEGKHEELAAEQADLVLLEPFILMNNGKIGNALAAEHYTMMIEAIKETNQDTNVILQPANPLSKAKYYPVQVDELKAYAKDNQLPYLDHWQAWPTTEADRLELLTISDPSFPNENGHQVWAEFLIDYFIAK
jgi:hypothetical protein